MSFCLLPARYSRVLVELLIVPTSDERAHIASPTLLLIVKRTPLTLKLNLVQATLMELKTTSNCSDENLKIW